MNLRILLGQTSSGKSDYAVQMAKDLESAVVVSCDSRQVYRGLDLGTGKVEGQWLEFKDIEKPNDLDRELFQVFDSIYYFESIPHFLIDHVDPAVQHTLSDYVHDWCETIDQIQNQTKCEHIILAGGTGLYAEAIIKEFKFISDKSIEDKYNIRKEEINKLDLNELQELNQIELNDSDFQNPPRLVSAILNHEFKKHLKKPDYPKFKQVTKLEKHIDTEEVNRKINLRLSKRIDDGMIAEVEQMMETLPSETILGFGMEYRLTHQLLLGLLSYDEYVTQTAKEIRRYAKRQRTWLRSWNGTKV